MILDIIRTKKAYQKAFKWICENSTSKALPYHNMEHTLVVFKNCYEASNYYKLDEIYGDYVETELCLAALFHDMNHSGSGPDDENIEMAIESFENFISEVGGDINEDLNPQSVNNIKSLIKLTKFPHEDDEISAGITIQQKIMRDSDMMSAVEENWLQTTIFGLGEEFKSESTLHQINNQIKFMLSNKLYTEWAKEKWNFKVGSVLSDLQTYKNILEGKDVTVKEKPDKLINNKDKIDELDRKIQKKIKELKNIKK